jgi:protein ImuA
MASRSTLADLRRTFTPPPAEHRQPLGVASIDTALGGGLVLGAMHELRAMGPADFGAAAGVAAVLAARAQESKQNDGKPKSGKPADGKRLVWIQHDFAALEAGGLHAVDSFGIALSSLVLVQVPRTVDALWAMEEALKCGAVAADIAEDGATVDLTATRRLSLAAREGGGIGLLLRHRASAMASAAITRWDIGSAPGVRDRFGGLGRPTFALALVRNRCGPCGRWIMSWDQHERAFSPALSRGVAQTARDRSARAQSVRAA